MATKSEVPVGTWNVDPVHSSVEFQVRNMGIVTIKGFFLDFEGSLERHDDQLHARGSLKAASITTHSDRRDQHLRAEEFFDVENHPEITFSSTRIEPADDRYRVTGELTIKGMTKHVELDATIEGTTQDPWGNERVGIEPVGEVDRRAFGLNWDVKTPGGVPLASDQVKILLHLGAVKG